MNSRREIIPITYRLAPALLLAGALLLASAYLASAGPLAQTADEGRAIFEQKCQACHTIGGGRLVGPDLQSVTTRRERAWLLSFIGAPDRMLAQGDPIATQLLAENNNVPMPNLGLTQSEVESLLAYLENPAGAGQATTQPQAPTQVLPPGNYARGWKLFTGEVALVGGGPPCMGCHNVGGIGRYGGGSLGPDLTQVYSRLGEPGLTSALANFPFPTMAAVFTGKALDPQEQADLLVFFAQVDAQGQAMPPAVFDRYFWFWGLTGMALLFAGMVIFWPRQRLSISEALRRKR